MKKSIKNVIIYDFRDADTISDCYKIVARTKFDNTKDLTDLEKTILITTIYDYEKLMQDTANEMVDKLVRFIDTMIESSKPKKKPNIFKRFWNWITRKK